MIYKTGDKLRCKIKVDARCLEMTNYAFDIQIGAIYVITDKSDCPNDYPCHWYELTS